jgi:peptidoglycan/LPS O-acetylase OafA/YrhL
LNILTRYTEISVYGASTYSLYGDGEGYTIVNFILCYMIGAGLRYEVIKIPKPAISALIYVMCVAVIYKYRLWTYNDPFVIIEGAAAFALFSQLKIKNSTVINKLARASFTVYLLHKTFVVRAGIKSFATAPTIKMLGHMALTVIGIYVICFVVYVIWSKVTTPVFNAVWKKTGVPEINLETA